MSLQIDSIRVFVRALEPATKFYGEILGLPQTAIDPEQGFVVYDAGGVTLLVEVVDSEDDEDDDYVGCFTGISFRTDDIFEAHDRLSRAGVRFEDMPASQPWGGLLVHLFDPDENILTLVQYPDE